MKKEKYYYRWLLIDNQETCYRCYVRLIEGYYTKKQIEKLMFQRESCFSYEKIKKSKISESYLNALKISILNDVRADL